jgi:cbb3-type cytochrome oxidase cytochrome c subunit
MAGGPGGPGGRPPMGGPGGMMGGRRAPDLGKVGGEPGHTVDWFVKYIRNPKSVKPDARMPAFDDKKIKDEDLRVLAEYLASLK